MNKNKKETEALKLRDNATHQLEQIKNIETGKDYLNKVKAIETWAKAEKKDAKLQNLIAEQKIRTQRILGNLIKQGQEKGEVASKEKGGANISKNNGINKPDTVKPKTLSEVGLTPNQSSQYKTIADIPEDEFETEIKKAQDESNKRVELTTNRILKAAKKRQKENEEKRKEYVPSDPIFGDTSKLLLKAGDKLQYIIQGDYTPKTASDFVYLDNIRHHMYGFIRMAGQMGIKIDVVWEKMAAQHGIKNELPKHLCKPEEMKQQDNTDIDDAEIAD